MGELDWDWIGIAALLLGGAAVLWGITNGRIKLQLNPQSSMEQRLARYPASAGAVVIKAQRARALKRMLPAAMLALPLVLALQFVPAHTLAALLCEHLGLAEATRWLLRLMFPGLPLLLAVAAILAVIRSVRVLRGGYAPPLDTVTFQDTIAVTGWRARLQAVLVMTLMPLMVVICGWVTYSFVQTFDTDANRRALGVAQCPKSFAAGAGPDTQQR